MQIMQLCKFEPGDALASFYTEATYLSCICTGATAIQVGQIQNVST